QAAHVVPIFTPCRLPVYWACAAWGGWQHDGSRRVAVLCLTFCEGGSHVRNFRLRFLAALSLVVLAVGVAPTTGGHATTLRVHPRAPITLTYWWWAESDVPGADKWMRQTIALFQQAHPTIRIKLDIQATDSLISNFQAAAQAHKGPDLATQWATIPVLSQAWANAIAPVSNYVPRSEIAQWVSTSENL